MQKYTNKEKKIIKEFNDYISPWDVFGYIRYDEKESLKTLEEIIEKNSAEDYEIGIRKYNMEWEWENIQEAIKNFLSEYDYKQKDISNIEEELRHIVEGNANWNYEVLFDFNVLLIDRSAQFDVEFEGVTSSPENVTKNADYWAFHKQALKYIKGTQFKEILLNCNYPGVGYIGIIVNGSDIIETIQRDYKVISSRNIIVGIHNWGNGSGYYVDGRGEYTMNLKNVEIDSSEYGIGAVYGTSEWKYR